MIFEVDSEILGVRELHLPLIGIAASIWGSEIGRHDWNIPNPEAFTASPWFSEYLSPIQQEDFRKFVTRSAHDHLRKKRNYFRICTHTDGSNAVFSLLDAKKLLSSPLMVVVESAGSDATFVKTLIRCFGNKLIKRAVERDWLTFSNAGGFLALKSAVIRMEESLSKEVAKRRTFVLFDSDHEHAQDDWRSKDEARARLELEQDGYAIHGLYKRMIENYLPDEALQEIVNQHGDTAAKERLKVVLSFSHEQRDFYHLKAGFDDKGKVPDAQSLLFIGTFADSKSSEFKAIRKGFGKSFPLVLGFNLTSLVTAESLRARCSHHPEARKTELEKIVTTLTEML